MSEPSTDNSQEADRLRALMEAGTLPRERLVLACTLGHVASRRALGRPDPAGGARSQLESEVAEAGAAALEFWGRRLARFGPQVMLRIGLAFARELAVATQPPPEVRSTLGVGIELCERWLQQGTPNPTRAELEDSARAIARAALELPLDGPPRRTCQTLLPLQRALIDILDGTVLDRTVLNGHYLRILEQAAASQVAVDALQDAARKDLLSWALPLTD